MFLDDQCIFLICVTMVLDCLCFRLLVDSASTMKGLERSDVPERNIEFYVHVVLMCQSSLTYQ